MTVSAFDAVILENAGFTPAEIRTIAEAAQPDGELQPPIDLTNAYWMDALASHREVMDAFYRVAAREERDIDRDDYDGFIDRWYAEVVKAADPWIWIDQFYLKVQVGQVTKARWEDARNKVKILQDKIR